MATAKKAATKSTDRATLPAKKAATKTTTKTVTKAAAPSGASAKSSKLPGTPPNVSTEKGKQLTYAEAMIAVNTGKKVKRKSGDFTLFKKSGNVYSTLDGKRIDLYTQNTEDANAKDWVIV